MVNAIEGAEIEPLLLARRRRVRIDEDVRGVGLPLW